MTRPDIEALDALHSKATAGEWLEYGEPEVGMEPELFVARGPRLGIAPIGPLSGPDLSAIVALHNAWPAIRAYIAQLEAERPAVVAMLRQGDKVVEASYEARSEWHKDVITEIIGEFAAWAADAIERGEHMEARDDAR
jgi:hypothetical protein